MIEAIRSNPFLAGIGLPLLAALLVTAAARALAGPRLGARYAVAGAIVGFLLAYLAIEALPAFPPTTAKQKVFYLAIIGGACEGFGTLREPQNVNQCSRIDT